MTADKRKPNTGRKPRPPYHKRRQEHGRQPATAANRRPPDDPDTVTLFGLHAVRAALLNPRRKLHTLVITENAERKLADALTTRDLQIEPQKVVPRQLDKMLGPDTVHQGVMIETTPLPEPDLAECAERAHEQGPIVILDQVTDPHNVGAVLRSCAVFGASSLIITRRNSPPLNGALAKSASGALELVPVHLAQNLARALITLADNGITLIGLDATAEHAIEDEAFDRPAALIFGAEGKGLRQRTMETCHRLCRISATGDLASLNVSNAAAVSLHLAAMRQPAK